MTRSGTLVPASGSPAESLRMLAELKEALAGEGVPDAGAAIDPLLQAAREGALPGTLWVGPKDEAVGIAVWEPAGDVGRRVALYLSPGFRASGPVHAFLDALEAADPALPLVEVSDQLPGVSSANRRAIFTQRGFVPVPRLDLGWPIDRPAPARPIPAEAVVRPLGSADAPELVTLSIAAYADNPIDVALFRRWRDPQRDAEAAVTYLVLGELGPFNPSASFGAFVGGTLAAATLVNDYHGALVSQVMCAPEFRRRGYASALVLRTVGALQEQRAVSIRLVVTRANERAYRLYRALGFEPIPGADGVSWLHARRLGLAPPAI